MNILIIDDHALFREGLVLVLGQLEDAENIIEAENAEQALSCVANYSDNDEDFDLILLDVNLPNSPDVFTTLNTIKELSPVSPVAILSATEDPALINQLLQKGASGFITKSSNSQVTLSAVRLILSGGLYVPHQALSMPTASPTSTASATANSALAPDKPTPVVQLTARQKDVFELLAEGLSNKEIARKLDMSPSTVKVHVAAILRLCDVSNRTQAVTYAQTHSLL